jgi:hypothetical protein
MNRQRLLKQATEALGEALTMVRTHGIGAVEAGTELTPWDECGECGDMLPTHEPDCPIGKAIKKIEEAYANCKKATSPKPKTPPPVPAPTDPDGRCRFAPTTPPGPGEVVWGAFMVDRKDGTVHTAEAASEDDLHEQMRQIVKGQKP